MFGLFRKADPYLDPELGCFERWKGKWRGHIVLPPHGEKPLLLAGGKDGPDGDCLNRARELTALFAALAPAIRDKLYAHYEPCRDAAEGNAAYPEIRNDDSLWRHVALLGISIAPMFGSMTIEIAIGTDWDEEHVLGARIQGGRLVELNGSIMSPF